MAISFIIGGAAIAEKFSFLNRNSDFLFGEFFRLNPYHMPKKLRYVEFIKFRLWTVFYVIFLWRLRYITLIIDDALKKADDILQLLFKPLDLGDQFILPVHVRNT